MELRDLEYFVVVSDELHFGRAAERLHIVPAAVSQRIRELERELGVTLFERTSRRVTLSEAGLLLQPEVRRALAAVGEVGTLAASLRAGQTGRLRIGFAPGSAHLINALIRRIAAERDNLTVVAESMWSAQALLALTRGELAVVLVRDPLPTDGVESMVVASYRDSFVAVALDSPQARHAEVPLVAFEGRDFLLNERDTASGVHDATVRLFADHGVAPLWRHHRLHEQEQQLSLVAAGMGAALVHSHRAGITHPGVVVLPLRERGPEHQFHLVWRTGESPPSVRAVIDLASRLDWSHGPA